jgi:sporulation protein YlmC with PRC-barrel domain
MLTRMLMTTVAAFVLAAPVAAQDQAKPETAEQLEQAQQELQQQQQTAPAGAAGQPATTAQDQPAAPAPAAGADAPAMTAEEPAAEDEAEVAEEEATPPADMQFLTEQEAEQFLAADEVIGEQVVNAADEEVGEIADLVMDPEQKLVGVVLSVGGFLGIGEKWVAVPVEQIQFPSKEQPARLLAEVTKEQLENAPDFVTRETVEAQEAAEQAQMQAPQQPVPVPAPTATTSQ